MPTAQNHFKGNSLVEEKRNPENCMVHTNHHQLRGLKNVDDQT